MNACSISSNEILENYRALVYGTGGYWFEPSGVQNSVKSKRRKSRPNHRLQLAEFLLLGAILTFSTMSICVRRHVWRHPIRWDLQRWRTENESPQLYSFEDFGWRAIQACIW